MGADERVEKFRRDGFLFPVPVLTEAEAARQRAALEAAEGRWGGSMHYVLKPHLLFPEAAEMLRAPALLDAVEAVLGPDLLVYETSYIIKEPRTTSFVSWHQDLTYWGLDTDEVLTAWIALSPATSESGCMRMIPGSHRAGRKDHIDARGADNILARGQTVADVDEGAGVDILLRPGEASLHHGWALHASQPNRSDDRRIGFSVVFLTPRTAQRVGGRQSAVLARGRDAYGHYDPEPLAATAFAPEMVALQRDLDAQRKALWQTA